MPNVMERYIAIIVYILIIFLFLFISKKVADVLTKFNEDKAIETEGNLAVAIRHFGLYLGTSIALTGAMSFGVTLKDILPFCLSGAVILVLFFVAHFINDFVMARKVDNDQLVRQGNKTIGLIEAGNYLACGILLNGAFNGEGGGVSAAITFFLAGEALMALSLVVEQQLYSFKIPAEAERNNTAAGVLVAGTLISYSLILRSSIAGDFTGWAQGFASFLATAVTGIVALMIFQKLARIVFLPKTTYTDQIGKENTASLVVAQGVILALSLAISQLLWH